MSPLLPTSSVVRVALVTPLFRVVFQNFPIASFPRTISLSGGKAIASDVYMLARALESPRSNALLNLVFASSIAARVSATPSSFAFDPAYANSGSTRKNVRKTVLVVVIVHLLREQTWNCTKHDRAAPASSTSRFYFAPQHTQRPQFCCGAFQQNAARARRA